MAARAIHFGFLHRPCSGPHPHRRTFPRLPSQALRRPLSRPHVPEAGQGYIDQNAEKWDSGNGNAKGGGTAGKHGRCKADNRKTGMLHENQTAGKQGCGKVKKDTQTEQEQQTNGVAGKQGRGNRQTNGAAKKRCCRKSGCT